MHREDRTYRERLALAACVLLLAAALPARGTAQDSERAMLEQLQAAIAAGDADRVFAPAADRVDVSILGASDIYSRAQARYVMAEFFRQHPPERFTFEPATRREGNCFAGGAYVGARGDPPLWLYVRLRQVGREWELREIRVERRARR